MNIAAVLAGGSGIRFGEALPKQFMLLSGKAVVEYSLEVFQNHPDIDEIVLVAPSDYMSICEKYKKEFSKLSKIIQGGSERYFSTLAVLNEYRERKEDTLILHDAARPMINTTMIDNVLKALKEHNAAIVAVPATDTIIQSSKDKIVSNMLDRSTLYNVQTPQAFKLSVLQNAYALALKDASFHATDDSAVVFNYLIDEKIAIVEGDVLHIKLTYKSDFLFLENLIQLKKERNIINL